ncbi:hypothetical protein B6U90_02410 [Thermoplasmatales archaeon ex4484_6]|nr:MAG: hypothetical protein B6U90_02410 [Thermoplasmatales archaeon ex4484_6]
MKMWMFGMTAVLIIGAAVMAGCIDEVVDPDLDFAVMDVMTNSTSPNPESVRADDGYEFLYVKVRIGNENRDTDLTVGPKTFSVDDNGTTEVRGKFLANMDLRKVDSIRIDPDSEKMVWVIFEVPRDSGMLYIRYRGTLDEPLERKLPDY